MDENKKSMNIKIDHGDLFYTDAATVIHAPNKFIFDFKQGAPRIDQIGDEEHQTIVLKHNTIIMEAQFAKKLLNLLKENMKNYEKNFGKIKLDKIQREDSRNKSISNPYIS